MSSLLLGMPLVCGAAVAMLPVGRFPRRVRGRRIVPYVIFLLVVNGTILFGVALFQGVTTLMHGVAGVTVAAVLVIAYFAAARKRVVLAAALKLQDWVASETS